MATNHLEECARNSRRELLLLRIACIEIADQLQPLTLRALRSSDQREMVDGEVVRYDIWTTVSEENDLKIRVSRVHLMTNLHVRIVVFHQHSQVAPQLISRAIVELVCLVENQHKRARLALKHVTVILARHLSPQSSERAAFPQMGAGETHDRAGTKLHLKIRRESNEGAADQVVQFEQLRE